MLIDIIIVFCSIVVEYIINVVNENRSYFIKIATKVVIVMLALFLISIRNVYMYNRMNKEKYELGNRFTTDVNKYENSNEILSDLEQYIHDNRTLQKLKSTNLDKLFDDDVKVFYIEVEESKFYRTMCSPSVIRLTVMRDCIKDNEFNLVEIYE